MELKKDADGKRKTQRLTSGKFLVDEFDWSPDGKTIVFTHQADPKINTGFMNTDISTVPADSGAVAALVSRPGVDRSPLYSPDGRLVAFISNGGKPEPVGLRDVYIVPANGGTPKKLANTPDRSANLIAWSRDGKQLYFSETIHTTRQVLALPVNGKSPRQLTRGNGVFGSVSFSRNGRRMAFSYQTTDRPEELYVSPLKKFKMNRLSTVNRKIDRPEMGRTELIHWTSNDGLPIEGLLTYPVGYTPGKSYPLILNVHGGPAGAYVQSFTGGGSIYMIQYFAQHGYAVLRANPAAAPATAKNSATPT